MKSVIKFFIIVLLISFPLSLIGQVKLDLKKKVLTIDKNTKTNIKKEVTKDQGQKANQNQGTQDKQATTDKNENKSNEETKTNADSKTGTQEQQSLQSFSKYDFVPGENVILFDDFSQDAVGDFPALWTTNTAGEINTLNIAPGNWFNLNSTDGNYFLLKNVDFPKNFIIELDIVPKMSGGSVAAGLLLYSEDKYKEMDNNPHPGNSGILISIEKKNWNTMGYKSGEGTTINGSSAINPVEPEKVNHVIIWVQNRRLRIYHKSAKVLDMPTNLFDGTKLNRFCFRLSRGASCGAYISNMRITDAAPDMRSKLITEGKLVSYGIYFDVNKDIVKPESYGTLKGIADVMNANPDVKVKIVGHTDSDGADDANLDLSKRRSASVKDALVKNFGIDASRL
ncbi:MAG TPA: OmpA family protein, partial [Bacteroidales bacterium]|nr:OmpA family protein [Bacteroidales bacterium]